MTTKARFLELYRAGSYARSINCLADFLEAVCNGEDLWNGNPHATVTWGTDNANAEYQALTALGWSAGSDYGSYGVEDFTVWSPHPEKNEEDDEKEMD